MEILSRLVGFTNDFERDLFFTLLYFEHTGLLAGTEVSDLFATGNIGLNIRGYWSQNNSRNSLIRDKFLLETFFEGAWTGKRNQIAHFNNIKEQNVSVIDLVNDTRSLMKYDRKRKNAVTSTIIRILKNYNLNVTFKMQNHNIQDNNIIIKSELEKHLKNTVLVSKIDNEFIGLVIKMLTFKVS